MGVSTSDKRRKISIKHSVTTLGWIRASRVSLSTFWRSLRRNKQETRMYARQGRQVEEAVRVGERAPCFGCRNTEATTHLLVRHRLSQLLWLLSFGWPTERHGPADQSVCTGRQAQTRLDADLHLLFYRASFILPQCEYTRCPNSARVAQPRSFDEIQDR